MLSIIIVNYNVKEFLNTSLDSIFKAVREIPSEIIVVDNASEDESVKFIERNFPSVKIIANQANVGFGAANNQAMEIASGDFIVLINPDTIVREDTFSKMLEFFDENPDAGMAGCKVLNPDGTLQLACRRSFPGPWVSFTRVTGLSRLFPKTKLFAKYNLTYLDENETYEVDAISGSFMMFRREVYENVGGFDATFFMYGEDLDLCYRVQKEGYKVFYVHSSEIIHFKGESAKRSSLDENRIFYDAMHKFVKKHFSTSFIVESILRIAIFLRHALAFIEANKLIFTGIALDTIFFVAAVYFAESVYHPGSVTGFPEFVKPWIYIVPAIVQLIISILGGAYKKKSLSNLRMTIALFFGFIFLSSFTFFFKQFAFSRAIVIIIYSVIFAAYSLWRIIFKIAFRKGLSDASRRTRTLIVGTSEKAVELAGKLKSSIINNQQVIGLIGFSAKGIGEKVSGFETLGSLETMKKVIAEYTIHNIIFIPGDISFTEMFGVVSKFQEEDVDFVVAGGEQDFIVGKSLITMLDNIPLMKLHYNISASANKFSKRVFDLVISLFMIVAAAPVVLLISFFRIGQTEFARFILQAPAVLIGKKSLVGPLEGSHYSGLYLGKPGLTGMWFTENLDSQDQNEIDKLNIFYARNQNVWLDLEILGKTFSKFFNWE